MFFLTEEHLTAIKYRRNDRIRKSSFGNYKQNNWVKENSSVDELKPESENLMRNKIFI